MSTTRPLPTVDAARYSQIEGSFAGLLAAPGLFLLQGEAIVPLEAVARSIGRPGSSALNMSRARTARGSGTGSPNRASPFTTSPCPSIERRPSRGFRRALGIATVRRRRAVHAEAATGVVNDLKAIAALARRSGAMTIVDAVASVGAEPLHIEAWCLDVTVVSAQKALGGPAGVTGVAVSDAAWAAMAENAAAPRDSVLSLLDWRERWLESDRVALPTIPTTSRPWHWKRRLTTSRPKGSIT